MPRLSNRMRRANDAMRSICERMNGISQATSTFETNPGTWTMSMRAVPDHLVRDVDAVRGTGVARLDGPWRQRTVARNLTPVSARRRVRRHADRDHGGAPRPPRGGAGLGRAPLPARRCRARGSSRARGAARRSGPSSRRRAGSGSTSTRRSAARATASPSSSSCSRSSAGPAPGPFLAAALAARGAPGGGQGGRGRRSCRRSPTATSSARSRSTARSTASAAGDGRVSRHAALGPRRATSPSCCSRAPAARRGCVLTDDEFDATERTSSTAPGGSPT